MKLSDLVGKRCLMGVGMGAVEYYGQECEYLEFNLDGVTYRAVEDPADGYRSYCSNLQIVPYLPKANGFIQDVICSMSTNTEDDVLVMVNAETGETLLEVGTEAYGDYYPCCHFYWHPEGLSANSHLWEEELTAPEICDIL